MDPYGPELVGPRPPLAMNPILLGTASTHSENMYNQNYFSHTDPDGTTAFERMSNAGYSYVSAGENMAAGTDITAAELEDFMMVDSGTQGRLHRVNLLDIFPNEPPPSYQEVGVGYYEGSSSNSIGNAFITEDFGTSASGGPFLLGVVYNDANSNNFYDIGEGISGVTITPSSGNYYAVSASAGGYAIPIGTSGTITVTAQGAGFGPITRTVTLTGYNIELDFTSQGLDTPHYHLSVLHANYAPTDYPNNLTIVDSDDGLNNTDLSPVDDSIRHPNFILYYRPGVARVGYVPVLALRLRKCNFARHNHRLRQHIDKLSLGSDLWDELWSHGQFARSFYWLAIRSLDMGGRSGLFKRFSKPR